MKPLNKTEIFVCEMIWGCVPIDVVFVRNSKLFQRNLEEFEKMLPWVLIYLKQK